MLLADITDYFDRAPRGAALETLQRFGVRSGTPFSSYLRAFRVLVASTVEKGGPPGAFYRDGHIFSSYKDGSAIPHADADLVPW